MPTQYKIITTVLALTGCGSLVITGELNPLMLISGLAIVPGYYRFLIGRQPIPRWVIGTLSVLTLIVFLFDSVVSGDVFLAVAHLTIAFQAIKSFDLREPWDHLQVFFMSLLQLIIVSELTHSLEFGAIFILFIILFVTSMVLSHFLKEGYGGEVRIGKAVFWISAATLIITTVFFTVLPRTPYNFLGKGHARTIRTVGFSEKVDFGSFGEVKLDPTVVMRIELNRDFHGPFYWRGISLAYFDGLSWKHSLSGRNPIPKVDDEYKLSAYDKKVAVEQKIYLEPIDSDVIFGLAEMKSIKSASFVFVDTAGEIYVRGKSRGGTRYTVYSVIKEGYPGMTEHKYLQLPTRTERIVDLAKRIVISANTDEKRAVAIEKYLRNNYTYSLSMSSPPAGMTPIDNFLFNTKKGFCEHYATSMVLMLRGLGIPSRIVTGFLGGEKNEYGGYVIVRQSNAHSWVEALIGNMWTRFDPTPAVSVSRPSAVALILDAVKMNWSRYVVGFSSIDQKRILDTLFLPFTFPNKYAPKLKNVPISTTAYFVSFMLIVSFLLYFCLRNNTYRRYGFVTKKYIELRLFLQRKGVTVSSATTAGDLREAVRRMSLKNAEEFLALYEEHRFGKKEMGSNERKRYQRLINQIRKTT
jgi:hypothetical protein